MARVLPYKGLSTDRFTALIKENNPKTQFPYISFDFAESSVSTEFAGYNSSVDVVSKRVVEELDGGVVSYPPQPVAYTRLPLDVLALLPPGELEVVMNLTLPFRIHQILDVLNEAFGLDLLPHEVVDTEYTVRQQFYEIEILDEGNLAWIPGTKHRFEAHFIGEREPRLMEDGSIRYMESGAWRLME